MTTWTRESSFGNTTRLTGRLVTIVSNSGFTPLLNANDTLTIEAPSINLSTYPDLSGTNGTINFLKSNGSTTMAVETENNLLNMNNHKITNLLTGTAGTDAVNLTQMNTAISAGVGGTTYYISRGGGSATAETTGQMTINVPTDQATIMNVNSVPKATFNGTALTMAMPIAMGANKITGLTAGTVVGDGIEYAQMNTAIGTAVFPYLLSATAGTTYATQASVATAIAQVHQPYEITRSGGSATADISGQITLSPPVGQATVMTVAGVPKATFNGTALTMAMPIAMGNNKITGTVAGTVAGDGIEYAQMNTAIGTAVSPYLLSATAGTTYATQASVATAIAQVHQPYNIIRGGGSAIAEISGQITLSPPVGQATIMTVAGVPKATFNGTALTMAMPIAMGSNKITGLTTATNNDEATNKGQVDSAIATALGGLTTYSISRGGGSATAEVTGQMTINVPIGQATIMNVNSVPKATFNGTALTMAMPIAMGANKITGLTAGTTATTDACNVTQMEAYVASATSGSSNFTYSVVNGDMAVNQRNNGLVSIHGNYIVDRWFGSEPTNSTGTAQQLLLDNVECPPNTNFRQCLRILGNSGNTNIYVVNDIVQNIEGKPWGEIVNPQLTTPGGVPTQTYRQVSLSFWARSSVTSYKFSVSVINTNQTTGQYRDVTTGTANTWARYTVTFTSGSAATSSGFDFTNGVLSCNIRVMYAKGSSQASLRGTTAGVWTTHTQTYSISNVTFDQLISGTTFDIVGFQWDVGAVAQQYKQIMYNDQLLACQRYYYRITSNSTTYLLGSAVPYNSIYQILIIPFKTQMRIAPLFLVSSTTCINVYYGPMALTATSINIVGDGYISRESAPVVLIINTGNGGGYVYFNSVGAYMSFNAE